MNMIDDIKVELRENEDLLQMYSLDGQLEKMANRFNKENNGVYINSS